MQATPTGSPGTRATRRRSIGEERGGWGSKLLSLCFLGVHQVLQCCVDALADRVQLQYVPFQLRVPEADCGENSVARFHEREEAITLSHHLWKQAWVGLLAFCQPLVAGLQPGRIGA